MDETNAIPYDLKNYIQQEIREIPDTCKIQ